MITNFKYLQFVKIGICSNQRIIVANKEMSVTKKMNGTWPIIFPNSKKLCKQWKFAENKEMTLNKDRWHKTTKKLNYQMYI